MANVIPDTSWIIDRLKQDFEDVRGQLCDYGNVLKVSIQGKWVLQIGLREIDKKRKEVEEQLEKDILIIKKEK